MLRGNARTYTARCFNYTPKGRVSVIARKFVNVIFVPRLRSLDKKSINKYKNNFIIIQTSGNIQAVCVKAWTSSFSPQKNIVTSHTENSFVTYGGGTFLRSRGVA